MVITLHFPSGGLLNMKAQTLVIGMGTVFCFIHGRSGWEMTEQLSYHSAINENTVMRL